MKPFLKWVGGKTQIIDKVFDKFPSKICNYYEPFCGGGSVFFELLNKIDKNEIKLDGKIFINDKNKDLINLYTYIKETPTDFIKRIKKISDNYNNSEYIKQPPRHKHEVSINDNIDEVIKKGKSYVFYYYRHLFNKSSDNKERAAIFLFLNKTCFRGLFREGKNGFNVPFGNYKTPTIYTSENLTKISLIFNKHSIIFSNLDFTDFCKNVKKNDFVYFDPPYYPLKDTSFVSYKEGGFNENKHTELAKLCNKINKIKIKFLHSNSWCDYNTSNYSKFNLEKVLCKRRINSKNPSDTDYEILIYN
jgi:DNA adenine methylase